MSCATTAMDRCRSIRALVLSGNPMACLPQGNQSDFETIHVSPLLHFVNKQRRHVLSRTSLYRQWSYFPVFGSRDLTSFASAAVMSFGRLQQVSILKKQIFQMIFVNYVRICFCHTFSISMLQTCMSEVLGVTARQHSHRKTKLVVQGDLAFGHRSIPVDPSRHGLLKFPTWNHRCIVQFSNLALRRSLDLPSPVPLRREEEN